VRRLMPILISTALPWAIRKFQQRQNRNRYGS
jgi:hypothetical protein